MPGLKSELPPPDVNVLAPEQARLSELTPPPMWMAADSERWHPGIASAVRVALSQYAFAPPASTRFEPLLVLPAQRPASPEMAESPRLTTHGVPAPGPSAAAGGAAIVTAIAETRAAVTTATRRRGVVRRSIG